jgi:hypothetical protein
MYFSYVGYNPRKWCVTAVAIVSQRLLMHVFVATKTLVLGLIKDQRGMAHFTTYRLVLTNKRETG